MRRSRVQGQDRERGPGQAQVTGKLRAGRGRSGGGTSGQVRRRPRGRGSASGKESGGLQPWALERKDFRS